MYEMDELNDGQEKEFSDSVTDSEEDIDEEFDAYLQVKKFFLEFVFNKNLARRPRL